MHNCSTIKMQKKPWSKCQGEQLSSTTVRLLPFWKAASKEFHLFSLTVKSTHKCVKGCCDATTAVVPGAAWTAHSYMDKAFPTPYELIIRATRWIYPSSCSKSPTLHKLFSSALASPAQNWPCTALVLGNSRNFMKRQFQGHYNSREKA